MDLDRYVERAEVAASRFAALRDRIRAVRSADPGVRAQLEELMLELSEVVAELRDALDDLTGQHRDVLDTANRYAGLFDLSTDAYFVTTGDGIVRDANPEAGTMFGVRTWSDSAPLAVLVAAQDHTRFFAFLEKMLAGGEPSTLEVTMQRLDRSQFPATVRAASVDDNGRGRLVRWLVRDDTERRAIEARLAHQATHDFMTGIPNRASFMAMFEAALLGRTADRRLVAVLYIDLDGFKAVNDRFGHQAGDDLLRAAVARIRRGLRERDVLGRLGGDEFAAVCIVDNRSEALHIAERVRAEVSQPFSIGLQRLSTTASIGVAMGTGFEDADEVIGQADTAMYQAKRLQKNRVEVFSDDLRETTAARRELDRNLRVALEHDELDLWYQPTIDLRDGRVTGVEALLRWERPGRGMLPAAEFLDVAEEYELLGPIDDWVLNEACRQTAEWQTRFPGWDVVTSVNVTPLEVARIRIVARAEAAVRRSGVDPSRICIEMSERTVTGSNETEEAVAELHALGMRVALDGFGRYTSLAQLRHLSIDMLKLDRHFLDHIETSHEDRLIVETVARLGEALGIMVVGGGVERPGQADALSEVGCLRAQGMFLAPPQPAESVTALIEARNLRI